MNKLFSFELDEGAFHNKYHVMFFGIPLKFKIPKLSSRQIEKLNKKYEVSKTQMGGAVLDIPNVENVSNTLTELINTNKSICRYGDGEFSIIFGDDLRFQKYSEKLSSSLREILMSDDEHIMVAIPDRFGSLDEFVDADKLFW